MADPQSVDVVVVGGGLAGLAAARGLEQRGRTCVVLEATAEVGGHLHSRKLNGQVVEFGGEAISAHHQRVQALARELGLHVDKSVFSGAPKVLWRIGPKPVVRRSAPLSASEMFHTARALMRLRRLARKVPAEAPWAAPDAASLDGITFGKWLEEQGVSGGAYQLAVAIIGGYATFEVERVSLLFVLRWISRVGGVWQAYRHIIALNVREGVQQLPRRVAERLRSEVILETPVQRVVQDGSGVLVDAGEHGSWRGRRAVLGIPISLMREMQFAPPLDEGLKALYSEMSFGRAAKAAVVAPQPPPIKHRISVGGSPVQASWLRGGRGATGLVTGDMALGTKEEIVSDLAAIYELDLDQCEVEIVQWSKQPYRGGTYLVWEPGQLTRHGPQLKRSHGLVHFTGADRSSWTGMEGAIENGDEVAAAIDSELRGE
jgi:monoamine oxidase